MFHYWAYGLRIASEIELPELLPHEPEQVDCEIRVGKAPEKLTSPDLIDKGKIQISSSEFLLDLPNCRYYAREGKEITLDIKDKSDEKSLRLFLLTNGLAAILHQRNKVLLHAGAIHTDKGLIVICGESGAGKSTTLQYLRQHRYKVFADDVLVLEETENAIIKAFASYPVLKLWDDSFEKLGMASVSDEQKLREHISKYRLSIQEEFSTAPQPIHALFQLQKDETIHEPILKSLNGFEAFNAVHLQLYRTAQLNTPVKNELAFTLINKLIEKAAVYQITRPSSINTLGQIKSLIEDQIGH
ncbi:MAG: AAA family ATPase [Chitinophagaceae bacterium]